MHASYLPASESRTGHCLAQTQCPSIDASPPGDVSAFFGPTVIIILGYHYTQEIVTGTSTNPEGLSKWLIGLHLGTPGLEHHLLKSGPGGHECQSESLHRSW